MSKQAIQLVIISFLLILVQAVVLNKICLFGVAVPFAFIYILLRMPVTLSREWLYTLSFITGLAIDIFSDTPGMNALACTIFAALRRPVLRMYVPREDELSDPYPCISTLGLVCYMKYAMTMAFIYCITIFTIESFTFLYIGTLILRIVFSTILTTLIILGIDSLTIRRREKRL